MGVFPSDHEPNPKLFSFVTINGICILFVHYIYFIKLKIGEKMIFTTRSR